MGPSGHYGASPVIANDHLYPFSKRERVTVVKCGDAFTVARQADLEVSIAATAALGQDSIYLRSSDALLALR
ncbi:MAG: hypothetical protein IIC50_01170 [Planctomycetes bacterium]|nr:hypothetical protein [Planctomycetota bacterium]